MQSRRSFLAVMTFGLSALAAKVADSAQEKRGIMWFLEQWENGQWKARGKCSLKSVHPEYGIAMLHLETQYGQINFVPHEMSERWAREVENAFIYGPNA